MGIFTVPEDMAWCMRGKEGRGGVGYLYAVVADGAVRAPGGPVELAGGAPLHAHRDAVNLYVLIQRGSEVILAVFIRGS